MVLTRACERFSLSRTKTVWPAIPRHSPMYLVRQSQGSNLQSNFGIENLNDAQ